MRLTPDHRFGGAAGRELTQLSEAAQARGASCTWHPYVYVTIVCMKKTFNVDDKLLKEARKAAGASTDTEAIRLGLEELVRREAYKRIAAYLGSETEVSDVPRRREPAKRRRKAA